MKHNEMMVTFQLKCFSSIYQMTSRSLSQFMTSLLQDCHGFACSAESYIGLVADTRPRHHRNHLFTRHMKITKTQQQYNSDLIHTKIVLIHVIRCLYSGTLVSS